MIRFGNLFACGTDSNPKVFVADSINILPGTKYMAQGFALVALDFVVPEVGECQTLHAEPVTGPFQVGDYLYSHSLVQDAEPRPGGPRAMKAWFKVISIIEENTVDHLCAIWSLEHVHGGKVGAVIGASNTIVNFGQATGPWITVTGSPLQPGAER